MIRIGVAPDIEVEPDPALVRQGKDPQPEKAIETVTAELERNPPPSLNGGRTLTITNRPRQACRTAMRKANPGILLPAATILVVIGLAPPAWMWLPQIPQPVSATTPAQAAEPPCKDGTTVRNVTDRTITYSIYPVNKPEALQVRRIAPDAIDCYRTTTALEIEFREGEKELTYSLDPGRPYAFRYEEGTRIGLFLGSHGRSDAVDLAPFVPTPDEVVGKMLELAGVTAKDIVYDIGCGDGRIVIAAARKYGARGVGIDLDRTRIDESVANARKAGVERLVRFVCMDATRADISEATVVTLYLLSESNELLRPMLEKQLRPGSRVVSHNYAIAGWESKQIVATSVRDEEGKSHSIFVYAR
jgi:precorrin-6B methylase 2